MKKKHAIFLVAEGDGSEELFDLSGLGFSSKKNKIERPIVPTVSISVNGQKIDLPKTPVRSTNENGIVGYDIYEATYKLPAETTIVPKVTASADNNDVKIKVTQADSATGTANVEFDYNGVVKTYRVVFTNN